MQRKRDTKPARRVVDVHDVLAARERIRRYVRRTPVTRDRDLSQARSADTWLKWESEQLTGSFKVRGALSKVLFEASEGRSPEFVATASTGNHGLGVAYAAKVVTARCVVYVPQGTDRRKLKLLSDLKAQVRTVPGGFDLAEVEAKRFCSKTGALWVSAYDDPQVIAGQGTVALEVVEDVPCVEALIVPASGGGLASGVALVAKSRKPPIKVVGVQATSAPFLYNTTHERKLRPGRYGDTIADGLDGAIDPTAMTIPLVDALLDDIRVVDEHELRSAMAFLYRDYGRVVEGAGAASVALLRATRTLLPHRVSAGLISGRNIARTTFREAIRGAGPAASAQC